MSLPEEITKIMEQLKEENFKPSNPEALKRAFEKLNERHAFKPGDLVQWKQGFRHRKTKSPMIVVKILDKPILAGTDESTPYFREPLDIILGTIDIKGGLDCYHYDSRRLEPYVEEKK